MEAARHLHLVDVHGEVVNADVCHGCIELSKKVAHLAGENTKLRREEEKRKLETPASKQIVEVLEYWRPLCMPRAKIVVGSERWQKTKARLEDKTIEGELAYTPLHLKAAVVGAKLSPEHVANGWLDAVTIFRDSTTVDKHIARCVTFKRETGSSALEIVDELMGPGLAKLAARCTCGHLRLDHERENPMLEIWDPPCAVHGCACTGWDSWEHEIDLWLAQRDRAARETERGRTGA